MLIFVIKKNQLSATGFEKTSMPYSVAPSAIEGAVPSTAAKFANVSRRRSFPDHAYARINQGRRKSTRASLHHRDQKGRASRVRIFCIVTRNPASSAYRRHSAIVRRRERRKPRSASSAHARATSRVGESSFLSRNPSITIISPPSAR